MKAIKHFAIAAVAAVATISSANAAWTFNTTTNAGDLIIGIKATGGQGQNTNLFYNLGVATTFLNGGGRGTNIANINTDLVATFGASWATRTDLFFGVIANRSNLATSDPDGAGPQEAGRILYLSRTASAPGSAALYGNGSSTINGQTATPYSGLKNGLATLSETAQANGVASLDISGTSTANGDAILNSFTAWTTSGANSDLAFNVTPSVQFLSQLGNGATSFADIQRIGRSGETTPVTTYIATVSFDQLGNISVIPEPSSMLLVGAAGVAGLLLRRRPTA